MLNSQLTERQTATLFRYGTLLVLAPITGVLIVRTPMLAWLMLGVAAVVFALELPPLYWAIAAVLAATLSRVPVAFGAPNFLNFLHFPLSLGAFLVACLKNNGVAFAAAKKLRTGIFVFLVVNVLSWLATDGEVLRPVLNWFVLIEPFLILYVLISSFPAAFTDRLLWRLLLTLSFLQVPLGLYQYRFISRGNPDLIQGTFIGSGTGAHVAGAVALIGVVCLVCRATAVRGKVRLWCFLGAIPLFGLSVIADAKQAVVAFVPALLFAIVSLTGFRLTTVVLPIIFLGLVLATAFQFYKPLQKVGEKGLMSGGLRGKVSIFAKLVSRMAEEPSGLVVGLGPGNTVSRVALMTPGAQLDATSSVSKLGLKTAPVTRDLITVSNEFYIAKHSSAWSPECSWFGLVGDLGLIGTLSYGWLLFLSWKAAGQNTSWLGASAKGGLIAMCLLGGVYSWLEEPGFTLVVALLIGLTILSQSSNPNPEFLAPVGDGRSLLAGTCSS